MQRWPWRNRHACARSRRCGCLTRKHSHVHKGMVTLACIFSRKVKVFFRDRCLLPCFPCTSLFFALVVFDLIFRFGGYYGSGVMWTAGGRERTRSSCVVFCVRVSNGSAIITAVRAPSCHLFIMGALLFLPLPIHA
ncbi:unnamed protein product [Ectocarpus fasciculatus]